MHDRTAMRSEGIAEQLRFHPDVRAKVDEGYRGLANDFPQQVQAPPRKPKDGAPLGERYAWREERRRQSSARICVEHTIGEEKKWRPLQRYLGRRESYAETHAVVAGLVSGRAARRPARRTTSTELVLARQTAHCSPTCRTARPARPDLNRVPSRYSKGRRFELEQADVFHVMATPRHGTVVARWSIDHPVHDLFPA